VCAALLLSLPFIAAGLVANWLSGRVALHRALGRRRPAPVEIQRLADELAAASKSRRPRVSQSHTAPVPAAVGLSEICVPRFGFEELSGKEQRALLAHELGHLVRRDPLWFAGLSALRRLAAFQPLNGFALSRLRHASELAADDFALATTGDRVALASALTAMTSVIVALPGAAAATGSPIVERVGRVLETETKKPRPMNRVVRLSLAGCVVAAALYLPLGASAPPDETADRIPWLSPSREEPNQRMLEIRRLTREWRRSL
jgi:beta-lactamase regulating signal transducer with metallopeptidase domain